MNTEQIMPVPAGDGGPVETFVSKPQLLHIRAGELINKWRRFEARTDEQRNLRTLRITTEEAIQKKLILPSETFIGMRVVDDNITRELPVTIKYLEGSARQLVCARGRLPGFSAELIEQSSPSMSATTRGVSAHAGRRQAATLGGPASVIYNPARSAGVEVEYIQHQDLVFNDQTRQDLNNCDIIARRYKIAMYQLRPFAAKYGFEAESVNRLGGANAADQSRSIDIWSCSSARPRES
ncbi:hypothetical protein CCP2SC5_1930003 [Azospirillaceae bacterium]